MVVFLETTTEAESMRGKTKAGAKSRFKKHTWFVIGFMTQAAIESVIIVIAISQS